MYCHETTVKPTITYESITDFDYTDLYVDSIEELRNQHNMLLINDEIKLNSEYWFIIYNFLAFFSIHYFFFKLLKGSYKYVFILWLSLLRRYKFSAKIYINIKTSK